MIRRKGGNHVNKLDGYIAKSVIRCLNGDIALYEYYRDLALNLLEKQKEFATIGEIIDKNTRIKLYEMVS